MVLCSLKDCIERLDVVAAIGREDIAQSKRAALLLCACDSKPIAGNYNRILAWYVLQLHTHLTITMIEINVAMISYNKHTKSLKI